MIMSFYRPYREKQVFSPTPNQFDEIMRPHNPMESLQGVALLSNTMGGVAFESNTLGGVADALNVFALANMLFPK